MKPIEINGGSLRHHPSLAALFRAAESRHLSEDELETYEQVVPGYAERAAAARAVVQHEKAVVEGVIETVFGAFPYEARHQFAHAKCTRDVRYVSAYATMTMLMGDPAWFEEKLLHWLRTILQAFHFPERSRARKVLFQRGGGRSGGPPGVESIRATYTALLDGYRRVLEPAHFELMQGPLQQAVDVLSHVPAREEAV